MPLSKELSDKLNRMGINPDSMKQKMQSYIGTQGQAFATPQEYASEIQRKQQAGVPLDDPQAARLMRQLMPQSFGEKPMTTFAFPGASPDAQRAQQTLMPQIPRTAQNMLEAVMRHQQANPISIPYAPGTPTLATRQAEEAMRAQQAAEALAGEKWDWQKQQAELDRQMQEREFAAQQAYRNAQLAASRAGGAGGAAATPLAGATKYQYAIQNAIDAGESLENIVKDIKGAVPEMLNEKINPSDVMRYAVEQFGQRYEGQRVQPGQDMDIKWFQNYKWYLDNLDKLLKEAGALEQRFQPIGGSEGAEGAGLYTPEEKRRLATILGLSLSDVDLYIKTNPNLIKELLSKKYVEGGSGPADNWELWNQLRPK